MEVGIGQSVNTTYRTVYSFRYVLLHAMDSPQIGNILSVSESKYFLTPFLFFTFFCRFTPENTSAAEWSLGSLAWSLVSGLICLYVSGLICLHIRTEFSLHGLAIVVYICHFQFIFKRNY